MLTPVELGLLIQSTIYFTVVSEADDFRWSCDSNAFFEGACHSLTFDTVPPNSTLNYYDYMVCGQGSISDFVTQQGLGDCGTVRAKAVIEEQDTSTSPCDSSCYHATSTDEDVSRYWCICSTDPTAAPETLNLDYDGSNECEKQFDSTIIALFVLLLTWILRVFLEGVWNYRRFFGVLQNVAIKNNALRDEDLSSNWEILNSPWRAPLKIPLGIFDILIAIGLCAIMFILGVNPYKFCIQGKLYSCVALAALSVVNVITLIPFVIVLKCIQCRVGSRTEIEMMENNQNGQPQ